jgi:twinkle protein
VVIQLLLVPKELINEAKGRIGEKAAFIIAKDLELKDFDEKNLKAICKWHSEDTPSLIWDSKHNTYKCFGECGKTYNILDHYMSFYNLTFIESVQRLFDETEINYRFAEKGVKTKREYRYPHHEKSKNRNKVEEYLGIRKISKETIDYCDIQDDGHGNIVWHFYDTNDVLLTVKYRPARKIQKGEPKEWFQKDSDSSNILFNMNRIDPTKPLVITEGQGDTLAIIESGYKNVVSVPAGAQNERWIEECSEWLDQFDKIIIWSDNDSAGINMRRSVCARLGSWRTYFIDLPLEIDGQSVKDASDVLYYCGKQKVLNFINSPSEIPVSKVVDLYNVSDYDIENAQGLFTGISEIDDKVYKIVSGTLTILTGINSSGKSVLVNQMCICEPLNQGYDTFVLSAELPKDQFKSWIEWNLAGRENISVKNKHVKHIEEKSQKQLREWYRGRIYLYDDEIDRTSETIMTKMEEMARKYGTKVFVLDNLAMIDFQCGKDDIYLKQKDFIIKLRDFANRYNVWVFLVAHPRKIEMIRRLTKLDVGGTGAITDLAHYVFGLHRYTAKERKGEKGKGNLWKREPVEHDCVIDVFKNRITGTQDFEVKLYFDLPSYRFYTKPSELWKRYKWNKDTSPIRTDDPNKHGIPEFMQKED